MGRDGEWFTARGASSRVHGEDEGASGTAGRSSRWRGVDGLGQDAVSGALFMNRIECGVCGKRSAEVRWSVSRE